MSELQLIDQAVSEYKVDRVYGLFSGGHDSLTACHYASNHPKFAGCIHIDTTTGLPETQEFVKETCKAQGWPLIIQRPFLEYTSLIMKYGFPGAPFHGFMYQRLKERPLNEVIKKIKNGKENIGLISGVRKQESDRRAEISDDLHKDGSKIWIPLIANFSAIDCTDYIADNNLTRSPIKDKIHMSGECFCGAFSRPGEFHELKFWYPWQAERIERWQELVRLAQSLQIWEQENGFREDVTIKEKHCEWGHHAGNTSNQMELFPMCAFCRQTNS